MLFATFIGSCLEAVVAHYLVVIYLFATVFLSTVHPSVVRIRPIWLDRATIRFRFLRPSSFNTALQLVLRPHFLVHFCVIRSPSYFVWSRTFLLGVGLTDLGHLGRYFGQNKEILSVFNGSVVYFNVGIVLTFLGRCCSTRQGIYFQQFFEMILSVECR
jgi:hypothetical protein